MVLAFTNGTARQRAWCQQVVSESKYPFSAYPGTVTVEWVTDPSRFGAHTAFAYTYTAGADSQTRMRSDLGGGNLDYDLFSDVFHHELGHAVLGWRFTQGVTQQQVEALFYRRGAHATDADWHPPTNWAQRVTEATTEVFKDTFAAHRKWNNRTNWQLQERDFKAWLALYAPSGLQDLTLDAWNHAGDTAYMGPFGPVLRWGESDSVQSLTLHRGGAGAPGAPYTEFARFYQSIICDVGSLTPGTVVAVKHHFWYDGASGAPWDWSTPVFDDFGHQIDPTGNGINWTLLDASGNPLELGAWNYAANGELEGTVPMPASRYKWLALNGSADILVAGVAGSDPLTEQQVWPEATVGSAVTLNPPWPYGPAGTLTLHAGPGASIRGLHGDAAAMRADAAALRAAGARALWRIHRST